MNEYIILEHYRVNQTAMGRYPGHGFVFCDRKHKPIMGFGLYKIVRAGRDKNFRPYIIVVPVRDVMCCVNMFEDILRDSWTHSIRRTRLEEHFNVSIDSVEDLICLLDEHSDEKIKEISEKPLDCSGVEFELIYFDRDGIYQFTPSHVVGIRYVNGETDFVKGGQIYKMRDQLVNATLTVYGTDADNIYMVAKRA